MKEDKKDEILTVQEVKDHLIIDELDINSSRDIERLIKVADAYLIGSIGKDYPRDDERAKQIALFVVEDLYDRSSFSVNENRTLKKLKDDFSMQLRIERMSLDGKT